MFNHQEEKPDNRKEVGAKKSLGTAEGADRRRRQLVQIRKSAKEDRLKTVRNEGLSAAELIDQDGTGDFNTHEMDAAAAAQLAPMQVRDAIIAEGKNPDDPKSYPPNTPPEQLPLSILPMAVEMIMQGNSADDVFHATLMLRKLLSVERNPPYQEVADTGVLPYLIRFLEMHDHPALQFQSAWAITNIAADSRGSTRKVVDAGAVPPLVTLLQSPSNDCRDQASWAIGNICGDGARNRDVCLAAGALERLVECLAVPEQPLPIVRNAMWALMNICRCKPYIDLEMVRPALPLIVAMTQHTDLQVVSDALWCLSSISDGSQRRAAAMVECGALQAVVPLLASTQTSILTPASRLVGNVVAGEAAETQAVINAGAIAYFPALLKHPVAAIRKEICWATSNIVAGEKEHMDVVMQHNVFPPLLDCLSGSALDVKKEAAWAVANMCFCGDVRHSVYILEIGAVPRLCAALKVREAHIVLIVLETLMCLLQVGQDARDQGYSPTNQVAEMVYECGGVADIESFNLHSNEDVYNLAKRIITLFFSEDGGEGMGEFEVEGADADYADFAAANNGDAFGNGGGDGGAPQFQF